MSVTSRDDENKQNQRPTAYSQTLEQLLEANTLKSASFLESSNGKNLAKNKENNEQVGGTVLSPAREPTSLVTSLRQMGRPSTRHGSRSGSSAANTVGSASSTSDSSLSASSSTSSSFSSNLYNHMNSLHGASEHHSSISENHFTSGRIDSSGQANINVWSCEDNNDDENNSRSKVVDKSNNNSPATSEEESFSKKLQELANRSMKIHNSNGSSSENQDETDLNSDLQRRSLTKVPPVILEHNESSDTASNRSYASAASNTIASSSTNTSRQPSAMSLPKTNALPITEKNQTSMQNVELITKLFQQLSPKDEIDQVKRQTLPLSLANEMDVEKIKTDENRENNENNTTSLRRKWQQPDQEIARPSFNNISEYPMILTQSKTIINTPVNGQIISQTSELASKQAGDRTSKNDPITKSTPFVSCFSSGIMIGSSLPSSRNDGKVQDSTRIAATTKFTTAKAQPQCQVTIEGRSMHTSYASRSSSRSKITNTLTKNTNIQLESRIVSQGSMQYGSSFEVWVKRKVEIEKKRRRKLEEEKAEEEKKKIEKKRDAERCFERWKADRDKALAIQRQKKETIQQNRELKALAAKEKKRRNAERTFEHWKRFHIKTLEKQRTQSASAEQRRAVSATEREATKKEEAERSYAAWLREKEKKQHKMEIQKREVEQQEKERKKLEAEYKQQLSKEAYDLWLQLKQEEYKYSKSLAYKILEFESEAKRRWPLTPWLPTGNTVARRFVGLGHRRKTLERPLHLKHSRSDSSTIVNRARSFH